MAAKRILTVVSLAALFMYVGGEGSPATSQAGQLTWNFDTGAQGWEFDGLWDIDGSPALLLADPQPDPASDPSARSFPNSLNYNNGINYDTFPFGNSGAAFSPEITITQIENFGWWCGYDTEKEDEDGVPGIENINNFDLRFVVVFDGGGDIVFLRQYLAPDGENPPSWPGQPLLMTLEDCGDRGYYHPHFIQLDPAWSPVTVSFQFFTGFNDTGGRPASGGPDDSDPFVNDHTGWFIDDVAVSQNSNPPPGGGGGTTRENANGDRSGNDLFGENWCGAGSSSSGLLMIGGLLALASLTLLKK